jgi:hypothetical protein
MEKLSSMGKQHFLVDVRRFDSEGCVGVETSLNVELFRHGEEKYSLSKLEILTRGGRF